MWEAIIRTFKWIGKKIKSLFSKKDEKLADKADVIDDKIDKIKSNINENNKSEFDKKIDQSFADVEKGYQNLDNYKENVAENINTRHNMLNAAINKLKNDNKSNDDKFQYKYEKIGINHIDITRLNEFESSISNVCKIISKINVTNEGVDELFKASEKILSYDFKYFFTVSPISLNEIDVLNSKGKKSLANISEYITDISNIETQINERIADTESIDIAVRYTNIVSGIIHKVPSIIVAISSIIDSKVIKQTINDTDKKLDEITKDLDDLLDEL